MAELDLRLDDDDLAELRALAPHDLTRAVPDWEQGRDRTLQRALHRTAPAGTRPSRLVLLAGAAAAVALVVGTGLARGGRVLPGQRATDLAVSRPCGQVLAMSRGPLAGRPRDVTATLVADRAVVRAGAGSFSVQLVAADGRVLTRAVSSSGDRPAVLGPAELCAGATPAALHRPGVTARVLVAGPGATSTASCLRVGLDGQAPLSC